MKCIYPLLFASLCNLFSTGLYAQNYGHTFYQHSAHGAVMCDAFTTEQHHMNPGYLMAAFKAQSTLQEYNFTIDRTSMGGGFNHPLFNFNKAYQMYADLTQQCLDKGQPLLNCTGISVIETNPPSMYQPSPQAFYALAGAYNQACFFSLMDAQGSCFNSCSYPFEDDSIWAVTKPLIIESTAFAGDYIICGSYNRTVYALRVNSLGSIIWSKLYGIEAEPRDMIEAAFGANKLNEFIVVGKSWYDEPNNLSDAFMMKLDQMTGNVLLAKRLNLLSALNNNGSGPGDQHYNNITVIQRESNAPNSITNGYALTGYTDPVYLMVPGHGLYHRVDTNLNFSSIEIMTTGSDPNGGEIVDMIGREVQNSPAWNYYCLVKNAGGLSVIRVNKLIGGFSSIFAGSIFREFDFHIAGSTSEPCKIGAFNIHTSGFSGIQLFGTENSNGNFRQHLTKAYFNGVTSCHSSTAMPISYLPASSHLYDNYTSKGELTECHSFYIMSWEDGSYEHLCGPADSVRYGNNVRMFNPTQADPLTLPGNLNVFPNPSHAQVQLNYALQTAGEVQFSLHNLLGEELTRVNEVKTEAGQYSLHFDLEELGLAKGVYLLQYNFNGEQGSRRLVYE